MAQPYYQDEFVTLYHGDALSVLPTLTGTFGAVLLDPPYSMIPNSFAGKDDGAAGTSGAPVMLLSETLRHARRLLPDGGVAGLICDWRRLPDVSYLATLQSFRIATCIAWTRNMAGMGGMFRSAWDPMLVLSVGSPTIKDKAAIRNVVHVDKPRGSSHPYEKPPLVWSHLLDRLPQTTALDPFAGTGSSAVAALGSGHKWVGIETDEAYCEGIVKRLAQDVLAFGGAA